MAKRPIKTRDVVSLFFEELRATHQLPGPFGRRGATTRLELPRSVFARVAPATPAAKKTATPDAGKQRFKRLSDALGSDKLAKFASLITFKKAPVPFDHEVTKRLKQLPEA